MLFILLTLLTNWQSTVMFSSTCTRIHIHGAVSAGCRCTEYVFSTVCTSCIYQEQQANISLPYLSFSVSRLLRVYSWWLTEVLTGDRPTQQQALFTLLKYRHTQTHTHHRKPFTLARFQWLSTTGQRSIINLVSSPDLHNSVFIFFPVCVQWVSS